MGVIDTTVTLVIVGGIGYLAYDYSQHGLCGGILKSTPACAGVNIGKGVVDFFRASYNTGDAGVPFKLSDCPPGWSNDGLTCREPIHCASGWDFFKSGCSGGRVEGRLNKQECPSDHPDKVGLLCYKRCPEGWVHTEGMPYLCRDGSGGNFWEKAVGDNWKSLIPGGSFLFK